MFLRVNGLNFRMEATCPPPLSLSLSLSLSFTEEGNCTNLSVCGEIAGFKT